MRGQLPVVEAGLPRRTVVCVGRRACAARALASIAGRPARVPCLVLPHVRASLVLRVVAKRKSAGRSPSDACRAR